MREVGAFEAKNKLGTLLDWVEKGEEILITRHGKAVARLIPNTATYNRSKAVALPNAPGSGSSHSDGRPSTGKNGKPVAMKAVRESGTRCHAGLAI